MAAKNDQCITPEMVSRICSGDINAYEEFVRGQWAVAVRTCWLILRNTYDAEEAAQDAFVSLYRSRDQIKDLNKFHIWFYRILLNAARQKWRHRPHVLPTPDLSLSDPDDQIDQSDTRITVWNAMHSMGRPERVALILCYFCDLTDREASLTAGWHLGTYKWRLARGRRQLIRELQGDGHDGRTLKNSLRGE